MSGYDQYDVGYGYAGVPGYPIDRLRVSGGTPYKVHILGLDWLNEVTGNDPSDSSNGYSGKTGMKIDMIAVGGGVTYRVHAMDIGWLDEVSEYNINDPNGRAGMQGVPIDAVMIQGRTYAVGIPINMNAPYTVETQEKGKLGKVRFASYYHARLASARKNDIDKAFEWACSRGLVRDDRRMNNRE